MFLRTHTGTQSFDKWIRRGCKAPNTSLGEHLVRITDPSAVGNEAMDTKQKWHDEGRRHIMAVFAQGELPREQTQAYDLLGNVGLYMAALRRHELSNPDREPRFPSVEASAMAQQLASSLGVAPRFATPHINLSNVAHMGKHKSFTWLEDEQIFITYNCLAILAYIRDADVLRRVLPLGVTHPVAATLLRDVESALKDVAAHNTVLDATLNVKRFFYNIRPYFKTYRVGRTEWRGANAGDFAAINEIDLLLGLCRTSDASYSAILLDKMPFMTREDQLQLQNTAHQSNLFDAWLNVLSQGSLPDKLRPSLQAFIAACEAHGVTALQHHEKFVMRFIQQPARVLEQGQLKQITASGPPLEMVVQALQVLVDKRAATARTDIPTRYADMQRLRAACA